MKLTNEIQKCYLLFTLFIPACASATGILIPCISSNSIQQHASKIDTAELIDDSFLVYTRTSAYQSNNLWWYISVGGISAETDDEAIKKGKELVSQTNIQENAYAIKQGNDYICKYEHGYIQATGKDLSKR